MGLYSMLYVQDSFHTVKVCESVQLKVYIRTWVCTVFMYKNHTVEAALVYMSCTVEFVHTRICIFEVVHGFNSLVVM